MARERFGQGYRHGWLYGEQASREITRNNLNAARKHARREANPQEYAEAMAKMHGKPVEVKAWDAWNTLLKNYCAFNDLNPEEMLQQAADKARAQGRKLAVLDIGAGSCLQWEQFYKKNKDALDLRLTVLSPKGAHPLSLPRTLITRALAATLHRHFPPNHFDYVLTNEGIHDTPTVALEEILHLLKPGGEALITQRSPTNHNFERQEIIARPEHFEIIRFKPSDLTEFYDTKWALHLRKLGAALV